MWRVSTFLYDHRWVARGVVLTTVMALVAALVACIVLYALELQRRNHRSLPSPSPGPGPGPAPPLCTVDARYAPMVTCSPITGQVVVSCDALVDDASKALCRQRVGADALPTIDGDPVYACYSQARRALTACDPANASCVGGICVDREPPPHPTPGPSPGGGGGGGARDLRLLWLLLLLVAVPVLVVIVLRRRPRRWRRRLKWRSPQADVEMDPVLVIDPASVSLPPPGPDEVPLPPPVLRRRLTSVTRLIEADPDWMHEMKNTSRSVVVFRNPFWIAAPGRLPMGTRSASARLLPQSTSHSMTLFRAPPPPPLRVPGSAPGQVALHPLPGPPSALPGGLPTRDMQLQVVSTHTLVESFVSLGLAPATAATAPSPRSLLAQARDWRVARVISRWLLRDARAEPAADATTMVVALVDQSWSSGGWEDWQREAVGANLFLALDIIHQHMHCEGHGTSAGACTGDRECVRVGNQCIGSLMNDMLGQTNAPELVWVLVACWLIEHKHIRVRDKETVRRVRLFVNRYKQARDDVSHELGNVHDIEVAVRHALVRGELPPTASMGRYWSVAPKLIKGLVYLAVSSLVYSAVYDLTDAKGAVIRPHLSNQEIVHDNQHTLNLLGSVNQTALRGANRDELYCYVHEEACPSRWVETPLAALPIGTAPTYDTSRAIVLWQPERPPIDLSPPPAAAPPRELTATELRERARAQEDWKMLMIWIAQGKYTIRDEGLVGKFKINLQYGRRRGADPPSTREFEAMLHDPEKNEQWFNLWINHIMHGFVGDSPIIVKAYENEWGSNRLLAQDSSELVPATVYTSRWTQLANQFVAAVNDALGNPAETSRLMQAYG